MCDYSLTSVKSRPAAVGDKLVTKNFGTGTIGFTDPSTPADERVAVCVLPGTEIAFDDPVAEKCLRTAGPKAIMTSLPAAAFKL